MRLPPALRAFLACCVFFTLLCIGAEAVCRIFLHWPTPYDYPSTRNLLSFSDFHSFFAKYSYFHTPAFFTHGDVLPYPAPGAAALKLFLIPQPAPHHDWPALARYAAAMVLSACVALVMLRKGLVRRGLASASATWFVVVLYACSFPFWFDYLEGNIEWLIWGVLALGIWAFCRSRFTLAAICIGVAGSMKLYPIIFIGLFLAARKYRATLVALASFAVSTVVSLWLVCPNLHFSWVQTIAGLGTFENGYMVKVRPVEVGFDHSLFASVKLVLLAIGKGSGPQLLGRYLLVAAAGGCVLFFLRIRKLPVANQVLCLAVAAIVLPPVSYDYTLLHLYAGLVLVVIFALDRAGDRRPPPGLWAVLLLLAFVLSPQSEFILKGMRFAGQLKCLALLGIAFVSLRYPFPIAGLPGEQPQPDTLFVPRSHGEIEARPTPV